VNNGNNIIELEQEIIKKEILPVISEKIEPIIGQIQRELVLVVDYAERAAQCAFVTQAQLFSGDGND